MTTHVMPTGPTSGGRACRAALAAGFAIKSTSAGTGSRVGELTHEFAHKDGRRLLVLTTRDTAALISARAAQPVDRWPADRPRAVDSVPKVVALIQSA